MTVLKILFALSTTIIWISLCNKNNFGNMIDDISYPITSESITESSPEPISGSETSIMETVDKINDRRLWIYRNLDNFNYKKDEFYTNYYDGKVLIYRYFFSEPDREPIDETSAVYNLYYDEFGKLISGSVTHYRSLSFDVYFQNDEVIYVDGPTQGGFDEVIAAIKESEKRSVILNDISYCLEHAYK